MERIKVTISKHKVALRYLGEGRVEESDLGKVGEYPDYSTQRDKSKESTRKAIEDIASKISGMNQYTYSSAVDRKESFYHKLIITNV